jgi:hypothetical protein
MEGMPLSLTWNDIALRLALTVAAGVNVPMAGRVFAMTHGLALGLNRSEHGKAAGIRTSVAMI